MADVAQAGRLTCDARTTTLLGLTGSARRMYACQRQTPLEGDIVLMDEVPGRATNGRQT
jgi:hypothetical protein